MSSPPLFVKLLFNSKSGFLRSARDQAVIVPATLDAHMATLSAFAIFGFFLTTFAHVEGPANRIALLVKLVESFQFLRTVCLGFG